MKKQYIAPELTQTLICASEIVCASTNIAMGGSTSGNVTVADTKGRGDDFDFDGGSGSDWGDELW